MCQPSQRVEEGCTSGSRDGRKELEEAGLGDKKRERYRLAIDLPCSPMGCPSNQCSTKNGEELEGGIRGPYLWIRDRQTPRNNSAIGMLLWDGCNPSLNKVAVRSCPELLKSVNDV